MRRGVHLAEPELFIACDLKQLNKRINANLLNQFLQLFWFQMRWAGWVTITTRKMTTGGSRVSLFRNTHSFLISCYSSTISLSLCFSFFLSLALSLSHCSMTQLAPFHINQVLLLLGQGAKISCSSQDELWEIVHPSLSPPPLFLRSIVSLRRVRECTSTTRRKRAGEHEQLVNRIKKSCKWIDHQSRIDTAN